jgi:hypothetical protein
MTSILGTWYPPSFGTGSFLLTNPPFAMTTTFTQTPVPPPDQFRPRDRWFGPDGRSYRIKPCSCVRGAVHLVDVVTGRHELRNARAVVGFDRQWWGGAGS